MPQSHGCGNLDSTSPTPLSGWQEEIEVFSHHLKFERDCSIKTIETYRRILYRAGSRFFKKAGLESWELCSKALVQQWLVELRKSHLSATTLNLYLSTLRTFFKWKFRADPKKLEMIACRIHSRKERLAKVIGPDQVMQLLTLTQNSPIAIRDQAILELFYSSGLRLNELTQLQLSALSYDKKLLRVDGKGNRQRWVPVGDRAKAQLEAWLALREQKGICSPHLFTRLNSKALSTRAVQKRVAYWSLKRLGLALHPHVLRHTFATHFLSATQDIRAVQEVLGHQKLATTQRYTHLDFKKISEVYDQTHPRQRHFSKKDALT